MAIPLTPVALLGVFSPRECLLVARSDGPKGAWLPPDQVAKAGGLSRASVYRLWKVDSWESAQVDTALGFLRGCNVTPQNYKSRLAYLRAQAKAIEPFAAINTHMRSLPEGRRRKRLRWLARTFPNGADHVPSSD
jgi:hypothetical protein